MVKRKPKIKKKVRNLKLTWVNREESSKILKKYAEMKEVIRQAEIKSFDTEGKSVEANSDSIDTIKNVLFPKMIEKDFAKLKKRNRLIKIVIIVALILLFIYFSF